MHLYLRMHPRVVKSYAKRHTRNKTCPFFAGDSVNEATSPLPPPRARVWQNRYYKLLSHIAIGVHDNALLRYKKDVPRTLQRSLFAVRGYLRFNLSKPRSYPARTVRKLQCSVFLVPWIMREKVIVVQCMWAWVLCKMHMRVLRALLSRKTGSKKI